MDARQAVNPWDGGLDATARDQHALSLRRLLGLPQAVIRGVGGCALVGGIFVLVGGAVGEADPAALLIALPSVERACRYLEAGGCYAFARAVFGPHTGFVITPLRGGA